jgi:hypothetical protein
LTLEFLRYRFQFRAAGTLYFPPGKAGNIARGAFGTIFRNAVCRPDCTDPKSCDSRAACPYARVFSPQSAPGSGPSGLLDQPRPFVFRASHLDGSTIREGKPFSFDVHLFNVHDPALPHFIQAFSQLGQEGLGPGRGRAELISVDRLPVPENIDLDKSSPQTGRFTIRFVTPTELKGTEMLGFRPEFGVLFARLRDRVSTLRALYGDGPLEIDFRAMGARAAAVQLVRSQLTETQIERLSSRTGQRHPLGGFMGEAVYEGDLGEFVPYVRLGKWVGVGRQTVWGKGEIDIISETSRDCAPVPPAKDAAGRES